MFFTPSLLLQLPREIPGLSADYIPTAAAQVTWGVYQVMFNISIGLFGIFTLISLLLLLFSDGHWHSAGKEMLGGLLLVLFLLSMYQTIYGKNFEMWTSVARAVTTEEKAAEYQRKWEEAADPDYLKTLTPEEQAALPWYAKLSAGNGSILAVMVPAEIYVAMLAPVFFVEQIFLYALWRMMANILFMFGPICIVFGVLGRHGRHVTLAWVGALVQMGLWAVWMALMSLVLNNAHALFYSASPVARSIDDISGSVVAVPNYYEEIIIMTGVMFLNVLGPVMISLLVPFVPHSNFVGLGSIAIMRSAKSHADLAAGAATSAYGNFKDK